MCLSWANICSLSHSLPLSFPLFALFSSLTPSAVSGYRCDLRKCYLLPAQVEIFVCFLFPLSLCFVSLFLARYLASHSRIFSESSAVSYVRRKCTLYAISNPSNRLSLTTLTQNFNLLGHFLDTFCIFGCVFVSWSNLSSRFAHLCVQTHILWPTFSYQRDMTPRRPEQVDNPKETKPTAAAIDALVTRARCIRTIMLINTN